MMTADEYRAATSNFAVEYMRDDPVGTIRSVFATHSAIVGILWTMLIDSGLPEAGVRAAFEAGLREARQFRIAARGGIS